MSAITLLPKLAHPQVLSVHYHRTPSLSLVDKSEDPAKEEAAI